MSKPEGGNDTPNMMHLIDQCMPTLKVISNADDTITSSEYYKMREYTTGNTNRTATLPPIAEMRGRILGLYKGDSGTGYMTADGYASETINGVSSIVVEKQNCGLWLLAGSTEWKVIATIGECEIQTIGSAIEMVYKKYYYGASSGGSNPLTVDTAPPFGINYALNIQTRMGDASNWYYILEASSFYAAIDKSNGYLKLYQVAYYYNTPYQIVVRYYI